MKCILYRKPPSKTSLGLKCTAKVYISNRTPLPAGNQHDMCPAAVQRERQRRQQLLARTSKPTSKERPGLVVCRNSKDIRIIDPQPFYLDRLIQRDLDARA